MSEKIWLVGEDNPRDDRAEMALWPYPALTAGWRLARILEVEPAKYVEAFERRNLLAHGKWSRPAARESAGRIAVESGSAPLVLLGAKVADAFGVEFEPYRVRGRFAVLPHPSGRSRLWNEAGSAERARAAVARLAWRR